MKKSKTTETQNQQERMIQKALKTGGFLFPETLDEMIEFEKNFGDTDVILPEDLQYPSFLEEPVKKISKTKTVSLLSENLAFAAREGSAKITEEVRKRMEADRKEADSKQKKRKK